MILGLLISKLSKKMNYKVRAHEISIHHVLYSMPYELKVLLDAHTSKKEIKLV